MSETITTKKHINKQKTIDNILDMCSRNIGFGINVDKFNRRKNDVQFIKEAAEFVGAEIAYVK